MNKIKAVCLIGLLGLGFNVNATIVYQQDNRSLSHNYIGSATPATAFADFSDSLFAYEAGASQTSNLTSTSMSGTGSSYAGYDAAYTYGAMASSLFSITFTVDELTDFTLSGNIDSNYGEVDVSLSGFGGNIFSANTYDGTTGFNVTGQFLAGETYQLVLSSATFFSDYFNEAWSFNLDTQPAVVPIPAAVWLLGSALIGLIGIGKRKQVC